MGLLYKEYLEGSCIYVCSSCRSHLATHEQIVSKVHVCVCALACVCGCMRAAVCMAEL